jgi:hypothetical protein
MSLDAEVNYLFLEKIWNKKSSHLSLFQVINLGVIIYFSFIAHCHNEFSTILSLIADKENSIICRLCQIQNE